MSESLWPRIEPLLAQVERPSRYTNGEYGVRADNSAGTDSASGTQLRFGLCYPAPYELGQSNQALQILYAGLRQLAGCLPLRTYLPAPDMAAALRAHDVPLWTLEDARPVRDLDVLGITLPYELSFPAVLEVLDLSGIPLRAKHRSPDDPIILGGGPGAYNPMPVADFFDAFFIGEAEAALSEIVAALSVPTRAKRLAALAAVPGIYVPSLHDGRTVITRRIVRDFALTPVPACPVVPFAETIHDRLTIELQRGCTRGCRFCQAGILYRPVRERQPDALVTAAVRGIQATGYDEVSLTSLSTSDYSDIASVLQRLKRRFEGSGVAVSIPSLRVDNFSVDLARILAAGGKKTGLTFAPEAGSQRLRDVINKNVSEQQLFETIGYAQDCGWQRVKLYFMIGLPTETDEDVAEIGELCARLMRYLRHRRDEHGNSSVVQLTVSVSTFVPKAHTPFQWAQQLSLPEIERRQQILRDRVPRKGIRLNWHEAAESHVEGLLARGSRDLAPVIEQVWRASRAAAWPDGFEADVWEQQLAAGGIDAEKLRAERDPDAALPWDHISTGVSPRWLHAEWDRARAGQTLSDCSQGTCSGCGACANLEARVVTVHER
ncbi:MAG: TIGR03960 family B12-binding radical SAM protein [Actinomycetes bacterium]|jgi:radical SAM family uncharacterized protein|nr:TIGR03960 family B12-binding radical SAM protein [Actinomycetes bacterium]